MRRLQPSSASGRPGATLRTTAGPTASGQPASRPAITTAACRRGTAGPPILDLLKHNDLTNTLVVVTRYYGRTKLGTGGLVRAYSEATKKAVETSGVTELRLVREIRAPLPYNLLSQLESYVAREGFEVAAWDFGERVVLTSRRGLPMACRREPRSD